MNQWSAATCLSRLATPALGRKEYQMYLTFSTLHYKKRRVKTKENNRINMPQETATGIILVYNTKYLLVNKDGYWTFLKGPEKEEVTTILQRFGIHKIFVIPNFHETEAYFFKRDGQTVHKEVQYILVETPEETIILPQEYSKYQWCLYEESLQLLSHEQTKRVIMKAHDFQRYN